MQCLVRVVYVRACSNDDEAGRAPVSTCDAPLVWRGWSLQLAELSIVYLLTLLPALDYRLCMRDALCTRRLGVYLPMKLDATIKMHKQMSRLTILSKRSCRATVGLPGPILLHFPHSTPALRGMFALHFTRCPIPVSFQCLFLVSTANRACM